MLCFFSSFRRKPESILLLASDLRRFRETRLTSVCGMSAIPGGQSLSLACPRESNQREGHPRDRGRRASCPATPQGRYGGSLTVRPCTDSERARILRAPLTGFFLRALAAAERDPGAKEERGSPCRRSGLCCALALGSLCDAAKGGGSGPRTARGGARDRAAFAAVHGWTVGKTPAARSAPAL